ncbi:MAG TPA: cysteine desulfurase [Thermomicrobiales bacterium]|nr:cysteine desulfurase [Thermomicrobiales bacterium]
MALDTTARDTLDVATLRADFPLLAETVNGQPIAYLDNAATSQKPEAVIRALDTYYRTYNANVHRGIYQISERATAAYEDARHAVARFIGAPDDRELIFTRGTTESINLVAYAWGRANVHAGDVVITSEMEHHSNLVPWQMLAEERGATLAFIPLTEDYRLDLDAYERLLERHAGRVKLVAVVHVSNTLGTINPVREIAARAHAAGATVLVDGAQSVPHLPVDVRDLGCDFLAFSGHKMLGPMGGGALWGRRAILEAMPPFHGGGSMIRNVTLEGTTYAELPQKFEGGTPSVGDAIGLGVAVEYLNGVGLATIHAHERALTAYALERLGAVEGLTIYGPPNLDDRAGVLSFTLGDIHPHDLASILDEAGVCVRAGHHCCQPIHARLGLAATARASVYLYNTPEEFDRLAAALERAKEIFAL